MVNKTYILIGSIAFIYLLYVVFKNRIESKIRQLDKPAPKIEEIDLPLVSENKFEIDSSLFKSIAIEDLVDNENIEDIDVLGYDDLILLSQKEEFHKLFMSSLSQSLEDKHIYYTNIVKTTKPVINNGHNDIAENMTSDNDLIRNANEILLIIKSMKIKIHSQNFDLANRFNICLRLMDKIVGRDDFKDIVSRDIIMFASAQKVFSNNFNNMIISGESGCGKSYCVEIIDDVYNILGITLRPRFIISMDSLTTGFVNESPRKTKKTMYNCLERIAFFDEAYILTAKNKEINNNNDVITTIVDLLPIYAGKINLIIAGYVKPMKEFLEANDGFSRRFPDNRRVEFKPYDAKQLTSIFINAILDMDERIIFSNRSITYLFSLIKHNYDKFTNGAGDIKNLSRTFVEFCFINTYASWRYDEYENNRFILNSFFKKFISNKQRI